MEYDDRGKVKGLKRKAIKLPKLDTTPRWREPDSRARGLFADESLFRSIWEWVQEDWEKTARRYESNPTSFYNAWWYVRRHPILWRLEGPPVIIGKNDDGSDVLSLVHAHRLVHDDGFSSVWQMVTRCDKNGVIQDDPALNTQLEVWMETGEIAWEAQPKFYVEPGEHYHNTECDTGAPTYEEAVIRLARKIWKHYGNDRRRCEPGYSMRQKARADKRERKGKTEWTLADHNAYAHPCKHKWGPGLKGEIDQALAETRKEGK